MTQIGPVQPVPYEIQSKYTKVDTVNHTIETHTYVSINGGVAVHKVETAKFTAYDKTGQAVDDNQHRRRIDKTV